MPDEASLYPMISGALEALFYSRYESAIEEFLLETSASGVFSERLKGRIGQGRDIVFSFLGRRASPDLTGYIKVKDDYSSTGFIVVEVKAEALKLEDIYQARKYAELLEARHAFLISPVEIPEALKRLSRAVYQLLALPGYGRLTLGSFNAKPGPDPMFEWFPENPFKRVG